MYVYFADGDVRKMFATFFSKFTCMFPMECILIKEKYEDRNVTHKI